MAAAVAAISIVFPLPSSPSTEGKVSGDAMAAGGKTPTKKKMKKDAGATKKQQKKNSSSKGMKDRKKKVENNRSAFDLEASGSCSFPITRVRRLVRGEGVTADARTTNDAVFLINKASEFFLERFTGDAYVTATKKRRKSISYNDLSSTVCTGKPYDFLLDFIPEKVKAADAVKAKATVET